MRLSLLILAASLASGAITNLQVTSVTNTQAIIRYNAPDASACTVEVSTSSTYSPLVNDVNGSLFSGSNLDSRSGSANVGVTERWFVIGTRKTAYDASSIPQSRALQAAKRYYFRVTCGMDTATGTFSTKPASIGRTYQDLQAPGLAGTNTVALYPLIGAGSIIDPQTGLQLTEVTKALENPFRSVSSQAFNTPYDPTGTWSCSGACTYSGTNQAKLFLPINTAIGNGYSYETFNTSAYTATLTAHPTVSIASSTGNLNVCLTDGGPNGACLSGTLTAALTTTPTARTVGGAAANFADWGNQFGIDPVRTNAHVIEVTGSGTTLTRTSGHYFLPNIWKAGTPVEFTGTGCAARGEIAEDDANSDSVLTLKTSSGCSGAATVSITGFGLLTWKADAAATAVTLAASPTWDADETFASQIDSSPSQDGLVEVGGPAIVGGGCPGYLTFLTGAAYWISGACNQAIYKGMWFYPAAGGVNPQTQIGGCSFETTAFGFVCPIPRFDGGTLLARGVYNGNYNDVITPGTTIPACGSPPCITWTVLEANLQTKLASQSAEFAASCCAQGVRTSAGIPGGEIELFWSLGPQESIGWYTIYGPALGQFVAWRSTIGYYPVTCCGAHSLIAYRGRALPMGLVDVSAGNGDPGPLSGTDTRAGVGPYQARVTAGIPTTHHTCAAWPGAIVTPIPAAYWPGGSSNPGTDCSTVTFDKQYWCDPSPYAVTISVGATSGSATITSSSVFKISYIGKTININSTDYVVLAFVDASTLTLTTNFVGSTTTYSASLKAEPVSASCAGTSFLAKPLASGDTFFVGEPTPGVTGYNTYNSVAFGSISEPMQLLGCVVAVCEVQRNYGGLSTIQAWSGTTYLYMGSGNYNYFLGGCDACNFYDFIWDYPTDPTGSLYHYTLDPSPPGGHSTATISGMVGDSSSCLSVVAYCYQGRYGANSTYVSMTPNVLAFTPSYNGVAGGFIPNNADDHPSFNPTAGVNRFGGGRVFNGADNYPATGTLVSGSLYKYSAAQRGCTDAATCKSDYKALPFLNWCNGRPMTDVSGPSAAIGGTSADWYKVVHVMAANEGTSGTVAGDLLANCPHSSLHASVYPGVGVNGGNIVDFQTGFTGPWLHGLTVYDFTSPALSGQSGQWIGTGLMQYRKYSAYQNTRMLPDGSAILAQAAEVDGGRTSIIMTQLTSWSPDSVNGAMPGSVTFKLPAVSGADNAVIEFGYAENGTTTGLYCTGRAEACVKGNQAGTDYGFAGESITGVSCAAGCSITVPGISRRVLYYEVIWRNSTTPIQTSAIQVTAVP